MITLEERSTTSVASAQATQVNRAVVEKAFTLLEAWQHGGEVLGLSELARRTSQPKSTSHRLLGILEAASLVEREPGGYRLGARLHGLSGRLVASHPPVLREACLPFLQDLYELSHETIHLALLDGVDVHCVEKIYGHRRSPLASRVDGVLPAHCTALGKALLAHTGQATQRHALRGALHAYTPATITEPLRLAAELRSVKVHGVAYDRRETHPDVVCVAAPVLDERGQAVAAISVSGPSHRFDTASVLDRLRRAARAASLALACPRAERYAA